MKKSATNLIDYPVWQEANEKLQQLRQEHDDLERDYNARLLHLNSQGAKRDRLTAEAEAFLNGQVFQKTTTITETLNELADRKRLVRRAIELQEERVRSIESELSREICKAQKPGYAAIVREMAMAVARLQAVARKERLFRENLRSGGVRFTAHITPVTMKGFGEDDQYGRVNQYFKQAIDAGYLNASEVEVS